MLANIYTYLFLLLSLLSRSFALTDYYSISNNKVLQTCAYVSNSEYAIQKWFHVQDPKIKIHFPSIKNLDKKIDVYTLIMGGEDMKQVTIGMNPYYKVCDEFALSGKFCEHESDDDHLKKSSLADLIDSGSFSYPIESFMLSTSDEKDHIYNLDKSGIYCIMFLTSEIPEDLATDSILVEVDWIQSYGNLLISDFSRLFTSVGFTIIYIFIALVLSFLVYRRIQKSGKTAVSIDTLKVKKFTIQYKFILFYWCYSLVYLSTSMNYLVLNKFDYTTDSFFVPLTDLISLVATTLTSVWVIYNLMLFSAGAWLDNFKNNNKKLIFIKTICLILIFEMLLYDIETSSIYSLIGNTPRDWLSVIIYIEYLGIFLLSFIWAILSTFKINDRKLKNIYYITIGLLTALFSLIIFGANVFSVTAQTATFAYTAELIFTLILTMIWFNVELENNQFVVVL